MQKYISKVIFSDNSEISQIKITPFHDIENENTWDKMRRRKVYQKQFKIFELDILSSLDRDFVKSYSEDEFDLISEDDCDCSDETKRLSDFDDNELLREAVSRKLIFSTPLNIISVDFQNRFSKIIAYENSAILDLLLSDLENKLKL